MARIRRPKTINGSEYTFGGGTTSSTAAGGFVKIAKGSMNTNSADHDGFLSSGDTVTVKLDAGTDIPQKDKYIYFDNAFDTSTGTFTYEFMNGDSALPAGMSWSHSKRSPRSATRARRCRRLPPLSARSRRRGHLPRSPRGGRRRRPGARRRGARRPAPRRQLVGRGVLHNR